MIAFEINFIRHFDWFYGSNPYIANFKKTTTNRLIVLLKNTVVLFGDTSYYCCIANLRKKKCYDNEASNRCGICFRIDFYVSFVSPFEANNILE